METSLVTVGRLSAVIGLTLGGKKVTLFLVDEGTKRVSFTSLQVQVKSSVVGGSSQSSSQLKSSVVGGSSQSSSRVESSRVESRLCISQVEGRVQPVVGFVPSRQ